MDKINIEGVARLGKIGLFPVRAIVIGLDLKVGSCSQHSLPATEQIATESIETSRRALDEAERRIAAALQDELHHHGSPWLLSVLPCEAGQYLTRRLLKG